MQGQNNTTANAPSPHYPFPYMGPDVPMPSPGVGYPSQPGPLGSIPHSNMQQPGVQMPAHQNPGYGGVPQIQVTQPGHLPVPQPSQVAPSSDMILGNFELERKRANVSDYNNPLDAARAEMAAIEQDRRLQEHAARQQRENDRTARKLARALKKSLKVPHDDDRRTSSGRSSRHSTGHSRKATPYASADSASTSDSDEVNDRKGKRSKSKSKRRSRTKSVSRSEHHSDDHGDSTKDTDKTKGKSSSVRTSRSEREDKVGVAKDRPTLKVSRPSTLQRKASPWPTKLVEAEDTDEEQTNKAANADCTLVHATNSSMQSDNDPDQSQQEPVKGDTFANRYSAAHPASQLSANQVPVVQEAQQTEPSSSEHTKSNPVQQQSKWGDPSTPVNQIVHGLPVIFKPATIVADPLLLRVIFRDTPERVVVLLHQSEVFRDTPNCFSDVYENSKHQVQPGGLLRTKMPAEKSSHLFQVIRAYLSGAKIVPLNAEHSQILCGQDVPTVEAYKTLKDEAYNYGLARLHQEITQFLKNPAHEEDAPQELFQLFHKRRFFSVELDELEGILEDANSKKSLVSMPDLRAIILDGCINFMARMDTSDPRRPEPVLIYRLAARSTPLSEAFKRLLYLGHPTVPEQFEISGELTMEQAKNVVFDIKYAADGASSDDPDALNVRKSTLFEVLQALNPASGGRFQWPDAFRATFYQAPLQLPEPAPPIMTSDHYLFLPYATIFLEFLFPKISSQPVTVVLRQITTATRTVLKLESDNRPR